MIVGETVVLEHFLREWILFDWFDWVLRDHQSCEGIVHGREVHDPCKILLRRLLEDTFQVNQITSRESHWNIEERDTSYGRRFLAEYGGEQVSQCSSCLYHHRHNEVELKEFNNVVLETDREVNANIEDEWYY